MTVTVNDVTIYYEVIGSGEPLVMVHGNGEDHTIFEEAAQKLSKRFTCYLPDSRGHGKSSPVSEYDYRTMAQDVLLFCDKLQLQKPLFYGFSDGGIIGLTAAAERPDFFSKLMISGANTHPRGVKSHVYYLMKLMYLFTGEPKIKLMLTQPHISDSDLHKIMAPTLVMAGSKDLIAQAHTEHIAAQISNSTLRILPGEGHGSYIVHKEKLSDLILEFCG